MTQANSTPDVLTNWKTAIRPFALPASTMPVLFGSVLAISAGNADFSWLHFALSMVAMVLLHSAGNLFNDALDYKTGVDVQINPGSGSVVRGWVSVRQAIMAAIVMTVAGIAIGLWLAYHSSWAVLWIGMIGVALGFFYSWGPFALKYHSLGDFTVFFAFGVLGSLGAWYVQGLAFSWLPVVWAIPMSILVAAILHANNWRDRSHDQKRNISTMAIALGERGSFFYYVFLLLTPYVFVVLYTVVSQLFAFARPMPWTFLLVLLSLPLAIKLIQKAKKRHEPQFAESFLALDGATGGLNLLFGLLCTVALGGDMLLNTIL